VIVILLSLHHRSLVSFPEIKRLNLPAVLLIAHCAKGFPNIQQDCHSLVLSSLASIYQYIKHRNFFKTFSDSLCNPGFTSNSGNVDYPVFSLPVTICQPPKNNKHRIYPSTALSRDFLVSSSYYPGPTKNYQPHQARNHFPSPVSSHLHEVVSLPRSLAKKHLTCLSKSRLPSPVHCHLISPARRLPLILVNSHLPSQAKKHLQSLVRSHLQSPAKSHLSSLTKSLITSSANTLPGTSLPSIPHVTSTLHPVSLTHVYHTSCLEFAQFSYLWLPNIKSNLHPVPFTYVYLTSRLAFTQYSHAQQHVYSSCSFLHSFFNN